MNNKVQMLNMLQDVVTEFSENPQAKRSVDNEKCLYNPPKNKPKSIGCAIGMYLPYEIAKKLDKTPNVSISYIIKSEKKIKTSP